MFDNFRNIIIAALGIALIGLWFIDSLRLKSDDAKIAGYESAIAEQNAAIQIQVKTAAEQLQNQKQIERNAILQEKQNTKDVKLILKTSVPNDCNGAIQWGISEAKNLETP